MPRFCANLSLLFTEVPMMERFALSKEAGFDAVEILSPYDDPVQDMVDQLVRQDLKMALINCPPPNYAGGDRGFAAIPGAENRFQQDFKRSLRYAKALGARHIHVMAGVADGAAAHQTFVENLRWAAQMAPKQSLTIEPLNAFDQPGYFLNDYGQAADLLAEVAAPNLGFQFDTYHAARLHGDVTAQWFRVRDITTHVQVGQAPDRTEPGSGTFDFVAFFEQLDADGYAGWVSAEYNPTGKTQASLGWLRA